jgi:hypothetical protein
MLHSTKSPDDIDYCLSNAYVLAFPQVRQKLNDGTVRLAFRNAVTGSLVFGVVLRPETQGTSVEFYKGAWGLKQPQGCF